MGRSNELAIEQGLTLRPMEDTVAATLDHLRSADHAAPTKDFGNVLDEPGLTPEQERDILRRWNETPNPPTGTV